MAQQNKADFKTTKDTVYADNTSQLITESSHRTIHENIADSFISIEDEWPYALKGPANVRACSTANVDITTALENGDTLDGVTLATNDRVLLIAQTDASQNGIYIVPSSGQASRSTDFNTTTTVFLGVTVYVEEGTDNEKTFWSLSAPTSAITVGTSNLTFELRGYLDTGERSSSTSITITKKNTVFTGSSTCTVTLPTPSSAITWKHYYFINNGTANCSFSGESFTAYPGTRYEIFHDGTNWIFIG